MSVPLHHGYISHYIFFLPQFYLIPPIIIVFMSSAIYTTLSLDKHHQHQKISQTIQEVASSYGNHVQNATLNRKVTAITLEENLPKRDALPVHRHMSHIPENSMRNYQYPNLNDSVGTYNIIRLLQSRK